MKKKLKKILWITSVCICSFVIAICGYKIYSQLNEYNVGVKTYKSLEQYVKFQDNQDETKSETKSESKNEHSKDVKFPKVDFKSLSKVNSDIVGWIYGEEGTINYPIAQTDNNNYYLEHLFDKTVNSSGCLFLECNNSSDFKDFNSVIYGHNMKNGSMFAGLGNYKEQSYYDAHSTMLLMTQKKNYVVEIFSGYVSAVNDDAWKISFEDEKEKKDWLKEISAKSAFSCKVKPTVKDNIITLSTCSYEFENARFVLHGVLREK